MNEVKPYTKDFPKLNALPSEELTMDVIDDNGRVFIRVRYKNFPDQVLFSGHLGQPHNVLNGLKLILGEK